MELRLVMRRAPSRAAIALAALVAAGCDFSSAPNTDVADVRGSWAYTGDQVSPMRSLTGTLTVASQDADVISGQVGWTEDDGAGGTTIGGGAISGRVIEHSDVDFDVLLPAGARRHVARLVADTMEGNWVQIAGGGASGTFRAVRDTP